MKNFNEAEPTKYIQFISDEKTGNRLKECEENGIFYGAFPVVGDSMTCEDKSKSIEDGNKVLVCELVLPDVEDCEVKFWNLPSKIPLVLLIDNGKGNSGFYIKTVTFKDFITWHLQLSSFNPKNKPFFVPMQYVKRVFEVLQVIKD